MYVCDVHDFYFLRLLFIDFSIAVSVAIFFRSASSEIGKDFYTVSRIMFYASFLCSFMCFSLPHLSTTSLTHKLISHLLRFLSRSRDCETVLSFETRFQCWRRLIVHEFRLYGNSDINQPLTAFNSFTFEKPAVRPACKQHSHTNRFLLRLLFERLIFRFPLFFSPPSPRWRKRFFCHPHVLPFLFMFSPYFFHFLLIFLHLKKMHYIFYLSNVVFLYFFFIFFLPFLLLLGVRGVVKVQREFY